MSSPDNLQLDPILVSSFADAPGQREIYAALMSGMDEEQRHSIEVLMVSNIERLIREGDSYST